MLKKGDRIAIVACSNAEPLSYIKKIEALVNILNKLNIEVTIGKYIFSDNYYAESASKKADELMSFYTDKDIKVIFDVSGGDLSNQVIMYLDFDIIKKNYKPFFGYSDLTTIINSLYTMTGEKQYLYQIRNLIYDYKVLQVDRFNKSLIMAKKDLFDINYKFIKGVSMRGILIGGNIRCFLKLAGTKYMPDFKNKILFLEAYSGNMPKIITYFSQLEQMGVFDNISGVLLGTFLELENNKENSIEDLVLEFLKDYNIPIAVTKEVGHKTDSKAIVIGKEYDFI